MSGEVGLLRCQRGVGELQYTLCIPDLRLWNPVHGKTEYVFHGYVCETYLRGIFLAATTYTSMIASSSPSVHARLPQQSTETLGDGSIPQ